MAERNVVITFKGRGGKKKVVTVPQSQVNPTITKMWKEEQLTPVQRTYATPEIEKAVQQQKTAKAVTKMIAEKEAERQVERAEDVGIQGIKKEESKPEIRDKPVTIDVDGQKVQVSEGVAEKYKEAKAKPPPVTFTTTTTTTTTTKPPVKTTTPTTKVKPVSPTITPTTTQPESAGLGLRRQVSQMEPMTPKMTKAIIKPKTSQKSVTSTGKLINRDKEDKLKFTTTVTTSEKYFADIEKEQFPLTKKATSLIPTKFGTISSFGRGAVSGLTFAPDILYMGTVGGAKGAVRKIKEELSMPEGVKQELALASLRRERIKTRQQFKGIKADPIGFGAELTGGIVAGYGVSKVAGKLTQPKVDVELKTMRIKSFAQEEIIPEKTILDLKVGKVTRKLELVEAVPEEVLRSGDDIMKFDYGRRAGVVKIGEGISELTGVDVRGKGVAGKISPLEVPSPKPQYPYEYVKIMEVTPMRGQLARNIYSPGAYLQEFYRFPKPVEQLPFDLIPGTGELSVGVKPPSTVIPGATPKTTTLVVPGVPGVFKRQPVLQDLADTYSGKYDPVKSMTKASITGLTTAVSAKSVKGKVPTVTVKTKKKKPKPQKLVPKKLIDIGYEPMTYQAPKAPEQVQVVKPVVTTAVTSRKAQEKSQKELTNLSTQLQKQPQRQIITPARTPIQISLRGQIRIPTRDQIRIPIQARIPTSDLTSIQKYRYDIPQEPIKTPTPAPFKMKLDSEPSGRKPVMKLKGFDVYVRKFGKWVKATKQPLLRTEAMKLGGYITETTPRASFRLVPSKQEPLKIKLPYGFRPQRFRQPRGKSKLKGMGEVFIEKSRYRIDQPLELKGITLKGIQAPKRKKKSKKKRTIWDEMEDIFAF